MGLAGDTQGADRLSCKEKYDHYCKRVLSNKDVLARILRHTMKEYRKMSPEDIRACIEDLSCTLGGPSKTGKDMRGRKQNQKRPEYILGVNTEDSMPGEGSVLYDIRFMARQPGGSQGKETTHWRQIMVDIEAQTKFWQRRLEPRAVLYGSKMICSQLGRLYKSPQYEKGRKVYSIWICTDSPRRLGNRIFHIALHRDEDYETKPGRAPDKTRYYDRLEIIFIYLNQKEKHKDPLTDFLSTLLAKEMPWQERLNILRDRFGLQPDDEMKEEMKEMCNLSEAIERDGIRKGRRQGLREGQKQGKKQGRKEGLREGQMRILRLITKMNSSGEGKLIFRLQEDPDFLEQQLKKYKL